MLVAAWSSVFLLYEKYAHWDLVVHFAATAMPAVLALRALERWFRLTPRYLLRIPFVQQDGGVLTGRSSA